MSFPNKLSNTHIFKPLFCRFDDETGGDRVSQLSLETVDWLRVTPFFLLHFAGTVVAWTGWRAMATGAMDFMRMA